VEKKMLRNLVMLEKKESDKKNHNIDG